MLKMTGTAISITRGDSAYIYFNIVNDSNNIIEFDEHTKVTCQVRSATNDDRETALLFDGNVVEEIKMNPSGSAYRTFVWYIIPSNTLEAKDGVEYVWDAQIEFENGDTYTFVESSKFKIKPEVSLRKNQIPAEPTGMILKDINTHILNIEIPLEVSCDA